ncbi:NTP transferase domain-containing protein [soil metagenome]
MITTAVVLVAGTGSRLRPLTNDRPKCLVEVGDRSILSRLLDRLADAGITNAILATGHCAGALEEHFAAHPSPIALTFVANPRFATTNNAYSLFTTEASVGDRGFLLCDGDVLLGPGVVERLLEGGGDTALLIEPRSDMGEEEMKARVDATNRVTALAKTLVARTCFGESIGIQKIGPSAAPALWKTLRAMIAAGAVDRYYEAAFQTMIDDGIAIHSVPVSEAEWIEIDDLPDLERARAQFHANAWDR